MDEVITGWRSRYRSNDKGDQALDRPSNWVAAFAAVTIFLIVVLLVVMAIWAKDWVLNPS